MRTNKSTKKENAIMAPGQPQKARSDQIKQAPLRIKGHHIKLHKTTITNGMSRQNNDTKD